MSWLSLLLLFGVSCDFGCCDYAGKVIFSSAVFDSILKTRTNDEFAILFVCLFVVCLFALCVYPCSLFLSSFVVRGLLHFSCCRELFNGCCGSFAFYVFVASSL